MTGVPDGWPCALLSADPPSVLDREAAPTADDLLPQILALTPRGAAWGTDEAGDGSGASPVQRGFWHGIAAWVADHLGRDFTAASQALPSALTYTLGDWEAELGLPDACGGATDPAGRALAVRTRFSELGGSSPTYFVCLAKSRGYSITIEEPTQFLCSVSESVGPEVEETWFTCGASQCGLDQIHGLTTGPVPAYGDPVAGSTPDETFFTCGDSQCGLDAIHGRELDNPNGSVWKLWIVHVQSGGTTFFTAGVGQCGRDPISGFVDAPALECLIRAKAPPSTQVVFAYDA